MAWIACWRVRGIAAWWLVLTSSSLLNAQDASKRFTQKAEVVASTGDPTAVDGSHGQADLARTKLAEGPTPRWIWGPDDNARYRLVREFPGGSKSARLIATGDNRMTIQLNGKRIASSDSWESPVVLDVQQHILPGPNQLAVQVENQGGPAGFVLKLVLLNEEGEAQYIVTDDSWTAALTREDAKPVPVRSLAAMGQGPWRDVFSSALDPEAEAQNQFQTLSGFRVERLFTVPREQLGSWVSMTFDPKGRILASDQEGKGLFRITPPGLDGSGETVVERLDVPITAAQGLLCAFDALYVSVNGGPGSGLYRVRDTNDDDQYDEVTKLFELRGGGEHGPHGLRLSPDGKSIFLTSGNHTDPPARIDASRLPTNWSEDQLLPRMWDANGHAVGRMAPGGWIAKTDPDGKTIEIYSAGYRNAYDIAFNADGELFAYDSDMEWDLGMPWYRPTRATHATSGSEFGWRSGTGKFPSYYPDSLPPMVDIGPGSPVGVTFGYGAKFPARYQKALYLLDWTFGTIYALHLRPSGSTYEAEKEEFLSRSPLPLTDAAVGPDGALYFTIGGRGTQSELFRVSYVGDESTDEANPHDAEGSELRKLRHQLETLHRRVEDPASAVETAWPLLSHPDRFLRYAARIALEHQPVESWTDRLSIESNPERIIQGSVALARQGKPDDRNTILAALDRLDFTSLPETQQLGALRAWSLTFIRLGEPDAKVASRLAAKLDPVYPSTSDFVNRELCTLLVYLKSPEVVADTVALLQQERSTSAGESDALLARNRGYGETIAKMLANQPDAQRIHYALALRNLGEGWTPEQRRAFFQFLERARDWNGGASYQGFLRNIDREAFENASEAERLVIEATGARAPYKAPELPAPHGPGQKWSLESVLSEAGSGLRGRNFEQGQRTFAAARCIICHRFAGEGGATGPDLTQAAGRFGVPDLAEAILDPSKVVSDQYRATNVATADGQVYSGRLINETEDSITLLVDPEDSSKTVTVAKTDIDEQAPSSASQMPANLIDTLNRDEVLDLLAYILSRGNPRDPAFRKP